MISGFGLSAVLFSVLSALALVSAGNTSSFLLLSIRTAIPMIIGFFIVRLVPLPPTDQTTALEAEALARDSICYFFSYPAAYDRRIESYIFP